MTTLQTKEDFKKKQQKLEKEFRQKPKNPNHIVHPNLTPRGKDILMRLQNKSLDTTGERSYTLDEKIVNARLKSKHEIIRDAELNNQNIQSLKTKLERNQSELKKQSPPKPEQNA